MAVLNFGKFYMARPFSKICYIAIYKIVFWQKTLAVANFMCFGKKHWQDLARFSLTTNKAICKLRI